MSDDAAIRWESGGGLRLTMSLTDFLLARIAEDENAARMAGGAWWWAAEVAPIGQDAPHDEPTKVVIDSPQTLVTYEVCQEAFADHIAEWHPLRVLAECEAKRRVVAWCANPDAPSWECARVLNLLALPYADHPDYRQEWKP